MRNGGTRAEPRDRRDSESSSVGHQCISEAGGSSTDSSAAAQEAAAQEAALSEENEVWGAGVAPLVVAYCLRCLTVHCHMVLVEAWLWLVEMAPELDSQCVDGLNLAHSSTF